MLLILKVTRVLANEGSTVTRRCVILTLFLLVICCSAMMVCAGCGGSGNSGSGGGSQPPQPTSSISVSVSPTSASIQTEGKGNFTATVQNDASNKGVTWMISGSGCSANACGTLSNQSNTTVTYTAPLSVPNPAQI